MDSSGIGEKTTRKVAIEPFVISGVHLAHQEIVMHH